MSEFIIDNAARMINLNGEQRILHPAFDRVDRWQAIGAHMLKMVAEEGFLNCPMEEDAALTIVRSTGIPLVDRETITRMEHDVWVKYKAERLHDNQFNLGIDEDLVTEEELGFLDE